MSRLEPGRPRVIRKVIRKDRQGNPKVARDRKSLIQMERIVARGERPCTYHGCEHGGVIGVGVPYARVASPLLQKRIGFRYVPDPKDYHFDCVPPEARPLVRFLR